MTPEAEAKLERAFRKTLWHSLIKVWNEYAEILNRIFFWGWAMRRNYDFDANSMYELLYYKLDRVYKCHRDYGHCMWNRSIDTPLMRKLRIARYLAKRLFEDDYNTQATIIHKQYGQLQITFKKDSSIEFYLDKTSPEEQKKVMQLLDKANQVDDRQRKVEKEYLFILLNKYTEAWWD